MRLVHNISVSAKIQQVIQSRKIISKKLMTTAIMTGMDKGFSLQEGIGRKSRSTKKPMNLFKTLIRSSLSYVLFLPYQYNTVNLRCQYKRTFEIIAPYGDRYKNKVG